MQRGLIFASEAGAPLDPENFSVYGHLGEGDRRAVAASMSWALFGPEQAGVAPNMAATRPAVEVETAGVLGCTLATRLAEVVIAACWL